MARFAVGILALVSLLTSDVCLAQKKSSGTFSVSLRARTEDSPKSGRFHALTKSDTWKANQTAVIVCDMWDLHHCLNATKRGGELAPRMDDLIKEARKQGAIIIHAPSSCTKFYADHPARKRAQAIKRSKNLPDDIASWCRQIPEEEQGEYPIDQTDGGEDDDLAEHAAWAKKLKEMGRNPRAPWIRQAARIGINEDHDFISDNGEEIWSILEQHGRQNVLLLGVHTNMCVLGRPFGLRQMAKNGKNVALVRDMTDTMYNPLRKPFVSHFTGTDLIIEHIEKWVCPTITSDQIIGGQPYVFKNDKRPHLVIICAEKEYRTNETLPKFAAQHLGHDFKVSFVHADAEERNTLPGSDVINEADVVLVSVRRRVLPAEQMKTLRKFIESGKPVLGIRTASHAFSLRGKPAPSGLVAWEKFDQEIFGGNYSNHHGNGPVVTASKADKVQTPEILKGVDVSKIKSNGSLYVVSPIEKSANALLIGSIPGKDSEPIAWTNKGKFGNRVFYTSLGHVSDFANPEFNKLLKNALLWAVAK
jgi:type 1 glutamine amidotransferase/nicotinamidase-related amidase